MIEIDKLGFSYGDKQIFECLSRKLGPVTCVTGPSGRGKTTLLRLLSGLERPQCGEVRGVPERVAVMFQEDRLLPWLTARENVASVLPDEDVDQAALWLERVELEACADSLPDQLSGGQKRRVALARALGFGGELLVLDEPFKGFDPELTKRMAALILQQNIPTIAALHAPEEMALLGGDILSLD